MARKKSIPFPTRKPATLPGVVFKAGLTVVIAIGLLSLLVWLGQRAGTAVADQPRFEVPISSIQVEPPPGVDRPTFLTEVRAAGSLPESVSVVSGETPGLLATAFAKHPWVAEVARVSIRTDRTIHVELNYRQPVLVVPMLGHPNLRLVDKAGVLLPPTAVPEGLAVLKVDNPRAAATPGSVVPDEMVKRAAELVEIYRTNQPRVIEKIKTGWRLTPLNGPPLLVSW